MVVFCILNMWLVSVLRVWFRCFCSLVFWLFLVFLLLILLSRLLSVLVLRLVIRVLKLCCWFWKWLVCWCSWRLSE